MKKLLVALGFCGAAAIALAQTGSVHIITYPRPPERATLDRLSLTRAWSIQVRVDGTHDGFYSLQLFPGKDFTLLVAQTFKGSAVAINADTGDILWRTPAGLPYRPMVAAAANDQAVFIARHEMLYALDRKDGKHLLYDINPDNLLQDFGTKLGGPPTAGLTADDRFLFVCQGQRLVRYSVPNFRAAPKARPTVVEPGTKQPGSPPLIREWDFNAKGRLSQPPVLSLRSAVVTTDDGAVFAVRRDSAGDYPAELRTEFQTQGAVAAPVANNKGMVYVPCQDSFLYAFNTDSGRMAWRFAGQAPIVAGPLATDPDVFVWVSKKGLFRLDRATGNVVWSNKEAVKVLAANQRFVYAVDRVGNMLILDYERGKALAAWDARDWILTIANDLTDRVFMAAHDGQIMCLHHRDQVRPLVVRTFESELPPPKKG